MAAPKEARKLRREFRRKGYWAVYHEVNGYPPGKRELVHEWLRQREIASDRRERWMIFAFIAVYLQAVAVVRLHMTKRWLIALLIAGLFAGKAFADCVPSPDTPASVIEYFQKLNKPLPEKFCAKEDAAPRASEKPSRREPPQASEQPSQEPPQADEDAPPPLERRGLTPEYLPIPEPRYPPPYGAWSRLAFEWLYSELRRHHHKNHKHKHHKHKHDHDDND